MEFPLLTYGLWTPHLWDAGCRAAVRRFDGSAVGRLGGWVTRPLGDSTDRRIGGWVARRLGGQAARRPDQRSTGRTPTEVDDSVDSTHTSAPRARGTALFAANFTGWPATRSITSP